MVGPTKNAIVTENTALLLCFNPSLEPSGITFVISDKLICKSSHRSTLKGSHLREINFETGSQIPSLLAIFSGCCRVWRWINLCSYQ